MSHKINVISSLNAFSFGVKTYPFQKTEVVEELFCQTVKTYFCREKAVCQVPRLAIFWQFFNQQFFLV